MQLRIELLKCLPPDPSAHADLLHLNAQFHKCVQQHSFAGSLQQFRHPTVVVPRTTSTNILVIPITIANAPFKSQSSPAA